MTATGNPSTRSSKSFRAFVVREHAEREGEFRRKVQERAVDDLPEGDLLVRVHWSSLNYKDALSATGNRGVTRRYPHTPGIDAAGVVAESRVAEFRPGDEVIVTSHDLGMNTPGGWGEFVRVPAGWAIPLPAGLSLRESMIYGTAGFTAGLALTRLMENGVAPERGEVLVTGATGGLGSLAVGILARAGYRVVAATAKIEEDELLRGLGAVRVIHRDEVRDEGNRPLLSVRWAAAVDTVGGSYLAGLLKAIQYGGAVASCGLAASPDLPTTVYPFILRAVSLLGIDSQSCPMEVRRQVWQKLAGPWRPDAERLERVAHERRLEELEPEVGRILRGEQRGRVVVRLAG